jgi:hypothetical protein
MNKNTSKRSFAAGMVKAGTAALLLTLGPATAQNPKAQPLPAIPVDLAALAKESPSAESLPAVASPVIKDAKSDSKEAVTDYAPQIGTGMKERERRLTLLNEAMMKLREAGETEDAGRVEERIRALLEMPPPSQINTKLREEIEQLRAKNDDLTLQLVAVQEELKRSKVPVTNGSRKGMAANSER